MFLPYLTIPVLLGNSTEAQRTGHVLFWEYRLPFHLFATHCPLMRRLSPGCQYHKLAVSTDPSILTQMLLDFAQSAEDKILLMFTDQKTQSWLGADHFAQLETFYLTCRFGEERQLFSSWAENSIASGGH